MERHFICEIHCIDKHTWTYRIYPKWKKKRMWNIEGRFTYSSRLGAATAAWKTLREFYAIAPQMEFKDV